MVYGDRGAADSVFGKPARHKKQCARCEGNRCYGYYRKPDVFQGVHKARECGGYGDNTQGGCRRGKDSKRFPRALEHYREGYGLTEATPVVGVNLPERDFGWYSTGARKGSIGKLFPGMSAKILDASTLKPLPFGMRGLLALKGANIFAGYLDNPEATNAALVDGWLVTGDLSRLDSDGFLYIDGRLSRFSKIGGEMVPHATVEAALNAQLGYAGSDVPSLAISSRLDEGKGEAIVLVAAVDITLAEAKEALRRAGISNLWMPKHLVRTDIIPLLASGKLDLKKLAKLAAGD